MRLLSRYTCRAALVGALLVGTSANTPAQFSEDAVRRRLEYIYNGQADRVRAELLSLQRQYASDPGVRYLDAVLTADGMVASRKFQAIVSDYPRSEWADDALYRVYQYYYSVGLYKTADQKLEQLKQQYPNSIYVVGTPGTPVREKVQRTPPTIKKPAEQEGAPTSAPPTRLPVRRFAVQAGAFATQRNAIAHVDYLATIGKKGIIGTKSLGDKVLYVVLIEGFETEEDARAVIADLKEKHGIASILVVR